MNRRTVLQGLAALAALPLLPACSRAAAPPLPVGTTAITPLGHPATFWRDKPPGDRRLPTAEHDLVREST